ncbi:MAG TPA: SDR family oxidoreductase [Stellaceae bacterium]|nr:SDR family oxidoreductase [Stellaceae bacterium]
MKLENRYALITGAGQGLGVAIAEAFVAEGASVLLCARTAASLEEVRDRLQPRLASGQQILIQTADVANPAQVDALVTTALSSFPHLDILVNNAGVYGPIGAIEDIDWAEWANAISVNLLGTVYPCRAVIRHFKERKYGKIVNLSGGGATSPMPRISAYAASKAAVVRFSESLAVEVEDFGIDINAIAPGTLLTRLMDQLIEAGPDRAGAKFHARMVKIQGEGGTPLETAAGLAVYLASAESDGITGRLISALWDPWADLHEHRDALKASDIYTLRRIIPSDRGQDWGDV